jgi:cell division protease FtsH
VFYRRAEGEQPSLFSQDKSMFGFRFLEELEDDFFERGPLKGRFFDLDYRFIKKDPRVGELIAWDEDVKLELKRNVLDFHKAMPKLEALGMNSSRGIILAGPPGTGKTMIGKWLASSTGMTSILVSAEMIRSRGSIKSVYERARKLSPTLIVVEDIDTTGGMDRRVADHPLLGEFLQCMDGMVKNSGVITVATTNHSGSIDPAIADRPGRFDRIIEVGLPGIDQRLRILKRKIKPIDTHDSITTSVLKSIANRSKGLSGAWVIEVIQFAQVLALSRKDELMTADDLETSLDDVLARRGLAYRIDSMPSIEKEKENDFGALFG